MADEERPSQEPTWRWRIGVWLAGANAPWLNGWGKHLMALELVRLTRGLTDMQRNIIVRRATEETLAEIKAMEARRG